MAVVIAGVGCRAGSLVNARNATDTGYKYSVECRTPAGYEVLFYFFDSAASKVAFVITSADAFAGNTHGIGLVTGTIWAVATADQRALAAAIREGGELHTSARGSHKMGLAPRTDAQAQSAVDYFSTVFAGVGCRQGTVVTWLSDPGVLAHLGFKCMTTAGGAAFFQFFLSGVQEASWERRIVGRPSFGQGLVVGPLWTVGSRDAAALEQAVNIGGKLVTPAGTH